MIDQTGIINIADTRFSLKKKNDVELPKPSFTVIKARLCLGQEN